MDSQNSDLSAVEIYDRSIQTFSQGTEILRKHTEIATRATAAGQALLNRIQAAGGLTPELDQLCNDHLALAGQRNRQMKEDRAPVTQIMTAIVKLFTTEENKIDAKVPGTIQYIIQEQRNTYARQAAEEARRQQEEAQRKLAKEREAVEIRAEIERRLARYCGDYLSAEKSRIQQTFNSITLETYDGARDSLLAYDPVYPYEHFNSFVHGVTGRLHAPEEVGNIATNVIAGRFDGFSTTFKSELLELKRGLIDRLPSKHAELTRIAEAGAAEKERMEKQRQQREQEEEQKRKDEDERRRKTEEDAIASRAAEGDALALFSGIPEAAAAPAPETRQGYEILIRHQAGYVQIFQFWFEREGKNLAIDKVGNTKLDQMKAFCEKIAHKTGEKIESQYLTYEPTYKAVNRKPAVA